jgi:predicted nucleic acid-binding protein
MAGRFGRDAKGSAVTLVDSSVWIAYFNGVVCRQTDLLDRLLSERLILLGDLMIAEVLQGFAKDADFRSARALFAGLRCVDLVGRELAIEAAVNFRRLRCDGITVRKTIDMLIATYCIANGHELLHMDKDFDPMARHLGLKVA